MPGALCYHSGALHRIAVLNMQRVIKILEAINHAVWGLPTLILILAAGLYLSFNTGFPQVSLFPKALKCFFSRLRNKKPSNTGVSPFHALCTALAATVGTGNLAGVAGAIAIGGPGSIFWMWVCAFFGMVTKFAEATLAVHYREQNTLGDYVGGPMYMIKNGLHKRWHLLAYLYCFFGVIAAFGVGNATQINAVLGSVNSVIVSFGGKESTVSNLMVGLLLSILITVLLLGGAKRIGSTAQLLIPFASLMYIMLAVGVLLYNRASVPTAFMSILQGAFSPKAVTGGMLGSAFTAMRIGASRGVFTNEAGMGTASIAHAAADVKHPAEQGLLGIVEVFLDTIVICTLTALVILCSGCVIPYGTDPGITLTTDAFRAVYGDWVNILISLSLCCFAIGTVMGWGLYGIRCVQYLFGDKAWRVFVGAQAVTVIAGAVLNTGTIWMISETVNGLMAIPCLIALLLLSPKLRQLTTQYKQIC